MPSRERRVALDFRGPYDWTALVGFLAARATPGVELVTPDAYHRTFSHEGLAGTMTVGLAARGDALRLSIRHPVATPSDVVPRVRRMFDLDSDPRPVGRRFAADPQLRRHWSAHAGIRVPGAWDGFELAVRAVLGQQVSVRAATTLAGRIAAAFGTTVAGDAGLTHLFPTPAQLVEAPVERAGVMPARAASIRALARAVDDGRISLDAAPEDVAATTDALLSLPGIGPWTVSYIAMRVFRDADAFPSADLVVRKAVGGCTPRTLVARARSWQPWRAYAVMLLWQGATDTAAATAGRRAPAPGRGKSPSRRSRR
ncbi:MAG: DNA-3-methyladenine glycosylase [Vicinamibacterales bacterium]